jgi:hypothetical protein
LGKWSKSKINDIKNNPSVLAAEGVKVNLFERMEGIEIVSSFNIFLGLLINFR